MHDLLKETKQTVLVPEGTVMYQRVGVSKRRFKLASTCRFILDDENFTLKYVIVKIGGEILFIENAVVWNGCVTQTKES